MDCEVALAGQTEDTVLELLDRVLNAGVVLVGDLAISVADVELIYVRLQLMVSSVETARQAERLPAGALPQGRQSLPCPG